MSDQLTDSIRAWADHAPAVTEAEVRRRVAGRSDAPRRGRGAAVAAAVAAAAAIAIGVVAAAPLGDGDGTTRLATDPTPTSTPLATVPGAAAASPPDTYVGVTADRDVVVVKDGVETFRQHFPDQTEGGDGTSVSHVELAPDGATAYVVTYRSEDAVVVDQAVQAVPTTGGTLERVTDGIDVAVSPDGTRLLVMNLQKGLVVHDLATGAERTVLPDLPGPATQEWVQQPVWTGPSTALVTRGSEEPGVAGERPVTEVVEIDVDADPAANGSAPVVLAQPEGFTYVVDRDGRLHLLEFEWTGSTGPVTSGRLGIAGATGGWVDLPVAPAAPRRAGDGPILAIDGTGTWIVASVDGTLRISDQDGNRVSELPGSWLSFDW